MNKPHLLDVFINYSCKLRTLQYNWLFSWKYNLSDIEKLKFVKLEIFLFGRFW